MRCIYCGKTEGKIRCKDCGFLKAWGLDSTVKNLLTFIPALLILAGILITYAFVMETNHNNIRDSFMPPGDPVRHIYVCHGGPTHSTLVEGVSTVTTIESRGQQISRWIDRDTFPRQAYIDHYWGLGWDLSDDDIREWFEGPYNVMSIEGTYWELVEVNDEFVVTNFIWRYDNMSLDDLNAIWHDAFLFVTRAGVIRGLEEGGADCVRR